MDRDRPQASQAADTARPTDPASPGAAPLSSDAAPPTQAPPEGISPLLAVRCAIGGVLMGLANLVPGISGGTMLVAAGIYTRFIDAISDLTRLRFRFSSIAVLAMVVLGAGVAIILLAGVIAGLMVEARWIMYSIFIGLTWGGVPLLIAMARPTDKRVWIGAAAGTVAMVLLAIAQASEAGGVGPSSGMMMLFLAGVAGASAMILPGVSGAYLLLLLGQYLPILASVDRVKEALRAMDAGALLAEARVVVPVGIGVVVGIVGVSNLLSWLLHRCEKATLGVLLGLVIGAPAGLYPFKRGIEPRIGDRIQGVEVTEGTLVEFRSEPGKWEERAYSPTPGQVGGAIGLILLGAGATLAISRLGRERRPEHIE